MKSEDIRKTYLDFFAEKKHKIVPSAPIVVKNDPTLLFTNAGMNQFKDYFLGNKKAENPRIADTQKCLRVSGKHNDLEEVGIDTYHHTMFEMLGNWSFGDYFKKEAISWAWELLTERYKLDKTRLYVTIFEGDAKEGLEEDTEALEIWSGLIQKDHILRGNKKDNFWEMGDTGPCGPCTEIHYDIRPENELTEIPGADLVNNDHPQVIEIWNNVFIQYNRKADGNLEPLPDKHVDTGMGFERLTRVLQGKSSNYDTDIFQPIIKKLEKDLGFTYGKDEKTDIAARVISDHIRAVTFTIADGQLPSNTGAGYVIRRILRRAVRYGYSFLNMQEPYIHQLVTVLAQQFKNVFPEVIKQEDFIKKVIQEEETSFLRTLSKGMQRFEKYTKSADNKSITGDFAFELYDTYGFPIDLTQLLARESGFEVDMEGYGKALDQQKARSRNAQAKEESDWTIVKESSKPTEFLGYDCGQTEAHILRYRKIVQKGETAYHVVLDKTPFYPEGGGQVGDTGNLRSDADAYPVINTYKENDLIIHVLRELPEDLTKHFSAEVDMEKRAATAANHSATHLLHAALRKVLGTHVAQKGSLVHDKGLRFDFSHFSKMTDDEISQVEKIVNEKIRQNIPLQEDRNIPMAEAQQKGAMALFGEKYGENVRMITFDKDYSVELCGGIHVPATGKLGYFKIISESAVAAGVRRIEAVTGIEAERIINEQFNLVRELKDMLKNPKDLVSAVENLRESSKQMTAELEKLRVQTSTEKAKSLYQDIKKRVEKNEVSVSPVLTQTLSVDDVKSIPAIREFVLALKDQLNDESIVLVGAKVEDKANIWLYVPKIFVTEKGLHAGKLISEIAKGIDGRGGGQDIFATAVGKNADDLSDAIEKGRELIISKLAN